MTAPASAVWGEVLREIPLASGWEAAAGTGQDAPAEFLPATVPGTIASVLRQQKAWRHGDGRRFDESPHWFRCRFEAEPAARGEEVVLRFGGLATLAEVRLNGEPILESASMFASHEVDVSGLLRERNELLIEFAPLSSALRERRGRRPAARWRTRVVAEQQLRWFRTTLLGRAPGFSPEPETVGPWRPVALLRRRRIVLEKSSRRIELDGSRGIITADLKFRTLDPLLRISSGMLVAGDASAPFELNASGDRAHAVVRIADVARWWPHTHGEPALYPVHSEFRLSDGTVARFEDAPAGFRAIENEAQDLDAGLALKINGASVFCRGVVWIPVDAVSLAASDDVLEQRLRLVRDGGFNMIRLAGTGTYESEAFHRLCDRFGLLVWQDMMFANMDYPFADPDFHALVSAEMETELARLSRHPSTVVICGNSEVEQQAALLGLDPSVGRGHFFGEELPGLVSALCSGVPYVPSAPSGGDMPFRTGRGVANYFGVGAYLRPLEDARRAEVKFASECLAFANVPEPEMMDRIAPAVWKRGIPRDSGTGWDFEDVRDHYLKLLYGIDPMTLRYTDPAHYWELSRLVSGEVMAEVFGEWRRPASPCAGGIVLWAADLEPGAGWGILDSDGAPKAAYWFLKRALAPHCVWMTDEGLNGIDVHVANDAPAALEAILRVALYRRGEQKAAEADREVVIPAHQTRTFGAEAILGRFIDASYAYRFGPAGHDLIVSSLHARRGDLPMAQSFRFPAGRPVDRVPIADLGIEVESRCVGPSTEFVLRARRLAWGVRVSARDFHAGDACFGLEPGIGRRVLLTHVRGEEASPQAAITAANAEGRWTA